MEAGRRRALPRREAEHDDGRTAKHLAAGAADRRERGWKAPYARAWVGLLLGMAAPAGLVAAPNPATATAPADAAPVLDLRIDPDGWGDAGAGDVKAVLHSAGRELLAYFPGAQVDRIAVSPGGGPITYFKRAADGAVRIRLDVKDSYWSQYAFQFGHELCHVLCGLREYDAGNKWFEESLCEAASLFVLRRMGQRWKADPPFGNWRGYARSLTEYADRRAAEAPFPPKRTAAEWYRENAGALRRDAEDRPRNRVAAAVLLPLLEAEPQHWGAVRSLNAGQPAGPQPFADYLQNWHDHAPAAHQAFVRRVAAEFGVALAASAATRGK